MHYYIYKITNIINNKFYYGMHSTKNLNDGYMGSGKRLVESIKKYGIENFRKEIIEFLPDKKSLMLREAEIVTEELISNPLCLNLKKGGEGGGVKGIKRSLSIRAKISNGRKGIKFSQRHIENMSKAQKGKIPWNKGKTLPPRTAETKAKLSKALTGRPSPNKGNTHSQEFKSYISKISKIRSDNNPGWWVLSAEARKSQKLAVSAALKGKPKMKVECPHCGKSGGKPAMKKWHFDQCKQARR